MPDSCVISEGIEGRITRYDGQALQLRSHPDVPVGPSASSSSRHSCRAEGASRAPVLQFLIGHRLVEFLGGGATLPARLPNRTDFFFTGTSSATGTPCSVIVTVSPRETASISSGRLIFAPLTEYCISHPIELNSAEIKARRLPLNQTINEPKIYQN